jgi:hypothetical protein
VSQEPEGTASTNTNPRRPAWGRYLLVIASLPLAGVALWLGDRFVLRLLYQPPAGDGPVHMLGYSGELTNGDRLEQWQTLVFLFSVGAMWLGMVIGVYWLAQLTRRLVAKQGSR